MSLTVTRTRSLIRKAQNSNATKGSLKAFDIRSFSYTFARAPELDSSQRTCSIDAEPLNRYRVGGYHPITLGDLFNDGRYKVLHKLGWGGYSTVWAATDLR